MAEEIDSPATRPEAPAASLTRSSRARRTPARRSKAVAASAPAPRASRPAAKPRNKAVRSLATLVVVAGLIATVALPAYGAWHQDSQAKTLQQVAEDGAQSMVVASEVEGSTLQRDTYSATTPEEIAKKKAAAAAAARARESATVANVDIDLNMVGPGTGAIRWPLAHIDHIGDGFLARGGEHMGVDLLDPAGTPIFAATSGVVNVSQDNFGGYGACITIDTVIDGRKVSTLYAHIKYGTRVVKSGQRVEVGQVIAQVGRTGRATANHLHFEVYINKKNVDPLAWLKANAS